jgi:predicted neuraminidase
LLTAGEIKTERIFGPEIPTGKYKHPASVDELQNGDLYLVFFSGKGEYNDDTAAVFGSRLTKGTRIWTAPIAIARDPIHSLGNAVIWQAPDGVVWLFYVVRFGEIWSNSRIAAKISRDGARTWSDATMITFEEGTMVRSHPIALSNSDYLLPIYHEVGTDTEKVDANCTSSFLRYERGKRRWTETDRVRSRLGNIQPAVVQITDDALIAFCRRGGDYEGRKDGWLVRTESHDGGRSWSDGKDSEFPNPNAAVDLIKLKNGHLLLVYNDSFNERTPLAVAISTDNGKSFPHRRNIAEGRGDFGYPTAIQTGDGMVHVTYTSDERTVIQHAVFEESDIPKK